MLRAVCTMDNTFAQYQCPSSHVSTMLSLADEFTYRMKCRLVSGRPRNKANSSVAHSAHAEPVSMDIRRRRLIMSSPCLNTTVARLAEYSWDELCQPIFH